MDSGFGSLLTANALNKMQIQFLVNAPKNKPTNLLNSKDGLAKGIKKDEWKTFFNVGKGIVLTIFKSSKQLNLFTNFAVSTGIDVKDRHNKVITKPQIAQVYKTFMGNVDKGDRRVHMYLPRIHSNNYKFKTFVGLFFMNLSNTACYSDMLMNRFVGGTNENRRTEFRDQLNALVNHWGKEEAKKKTFFKWKQHAIVQYSKKQRVEDGGSPDSKSK